MQSSTSSFPRVLTHSLTRSLTRLTLGSRYPQCWVASCGRACFGNQQNQEQTCTSMPSSESRGIHPRRLQMRPTFTSTGNSCMRKHSSMMHATLLRPRPTPLKNSIFWVCCSLNNVFLCVTPEHLIRAITACPWPAIDANLCGPCNVNPAEHVEPACQRDMSSTKMSATAHSASGLQGTCGRPQRQASYTYFITPRTTIL